MTILFFVVRMRTNFLYFVILQKKTLGIINIKSKNTFKFFIQRNPIFKFQGKIHLENAFIFEGICCWESSCRSFKFMVHFFLGSAQLWNSTESLLNLTSLTKVNYCGWLGQHGPCYNTNTRPNFSNTRLSF